MITIRYALRLLAPCAFALCVCPRQAPAQTDAPWTRLSPAADVSLFDQVPFLSNGVRTPAGHALVFPSGYGTFRTDDGGDSWTRAEGGRFPTLTIRDAVASPGGALWAATWEDGVWRSDDDGRTWTPAGLQANAVEVSPAVTLDGIARLADGTLVAVQNTGGVWVLVPSAEWERVGDVSEGVAPRVAVYGLAVAPAGALLASTSDGVRRSADGGRTWTPSGLVGVRLLHDVVFGADGAAYAGGWFSPEQALDGVYRSDDGGQTWSRAGLDGDRVQALAVEADGAVLAGLHTAGPSAGGLWRSTDGGRTWDGVYTSDFAGTPPVRVRPRAILLPTDADPRTLLPSTTEGVYRSGAGLEGWEPAPGVPLVSVGVGELAAVGDWIVGNAGYASEGGGEWLELSYPHSFSRRPYPAPLAPGPDGSPHFVFGRRVYRTDVAGSTWTELADGQSENGSFGALLVTERALIAWEARGPEAALWRAEGGTWVEALRVAGVAATLLALPDGSVLASAGTAPGEGAGGGIWRTDDGGSTWDRVLEVAAGPLAVGSDGTAYAGSGAGVWRSTDAGRTWVQTGTRPVGDLAVTPDGALFAAGGLGSGLLGVVRSADGGASWVPVVDGLTDWRVRDLEVSPKGALYLSTAEAVWRYEGETRAVPAEGGASGSLALSAWPNPTRGPVRMQFEVPQAGPVRAAMYDVLGREVAVLLEGDRPAGPHEATFDAGALAPGVYVVRFEAGGRVVARPVTVVR